MNGKITYTENFFDNVFLEKEIINYSQVTGKMGRRDKQVIKHLQEFGIDGKSCLDVGPGTGRWLQLLKDNGASYLGAVDISAESIMRCSSLCNKIQKADVENDRFDFESNSFDIIVSFMILEHLRNPMNYLSEIIRVAKDKSLILMTIPNITSFVSRIRMILGIMPQAVTCDETHVKFYTKRELKRLFFPHHLKPEVIPTSFSLNPFNTRSFRIPTNRFLSSLDDHTLFKVEVTKA